jgi:hypothetical protein
MFSRLITAVALYGCLSTSAFAQERQWNLESSEKQAFLVFGVPNTDDIGFSLWCEVGKNQISAFITENQVPLKAGESVSMLISVDGKQQSLRGLVAKDAASGQMTVESKFGLKDSLISSLQSGQSLSISVKGHITTLPFGNADFAGLLSACKGEDAN